MLHLFWRKMILKTYLPYFRAFGPTEKATLIFGKWFSILKTINHFLSLSISFSNQQAQLERRQDLTREQYKVQSKNSPSANVHISSLLPSF
jgi:hypothetical protein